MYGRFGEMKLQKCIVFYLCVSVLLLYHIGRTSAKSNLTNSMEENCCSGQVRDIAIASLVGVILNGIITTVGIVTLILMQHFLSKRAVRRRYKPARRAPPPPSSATSEVCWKERQQSTTDSGQVKKIHSITNSAYQPTAVDVAAGNTYSEENTSYIYETVSSDLK